MPDGERDLQHGEILKRLDDLHKAVHSTENPVGLRLDVRDIRRTLEGYGREKGLVERVENLEREINQKLQNIEGQVESLQQAFNNAQTSGAVRDAKQEGVKIGRGALIAGAIALLGVLGTLSAIVSSWLARFAPPGG